MKLQIPETINRKSCLMKTIIIEDEIESLRLYKEYLRQDNPEITVVGEATNLAEARQLLSQHLPDLALLDIRIDADNSTTFELLEELKAADRLEFDIIFITAMGTGEYILQALEYSFLKYITKPVKRQQFREAILKALERKHDRDTFTRQVGIMLETIRQSRSIELTTIAIPVLRGMIEMININDILYICSYQRGTMTQVYMKGKEKPLVSVRSIGQFRSLLAGAGDFFQIHESIIIYLPALRRYDPSERAATMRNGKVLYASVRAGRQLRNHLLKGEYPEGERLDEKGLLQWVWRLLGRKH